MNYRDFEQSAPRHAGGPDSRELVAARAGFLAALDAAQGVDPEGTQPMEFEGSASFVPKPVARRHAQPNALGDRFRGFIDRLQGSRKRQVGILALSALATTGVSMGVTLGEQPVKSGTSLNMTISPYEKATTTPHAAATTPNAYTNVGDTSRHSSAKPSASATAKPSVSMSPSALPSSTLESPVASASGSITPSESASSTPTAEQSSPATAGTPSAPVNGIETPTTTPDAPAS